jgi:hypothetical protein
MDIHAPHQAVHNWRDFFTHIVIITIGLFLALMLEAGVDWLHHRHVVHEARANIREEIDSNRQNAEKDLVYIQQDIDRTHANIDTIHRLRANQKSFHGSLTFTMQYSGFDAAAWTTAQDTGALGFMPYKEVQDDAGLYTEQQLLNDQAIEIFHRQTLAVTPVFMEDDSFDVPAARIESMLHDTAATLIELNTLKQLVQQYDDACIAQLKK